jgi:Tol biopolymer transport system component
MRALDCHTQDKDEATSGECADRAIIESQMETILGSKGFLQSPRMARFLRYIVEAALKGNPGDLKETSIGIAVYDRQPGYDPKLDPVVRNEARRLRSKLQLYYGSESSDAKILIALPRGGYTPTFSSLLDSTVSGVVPDEVQLLPSETPEEPDPGSATLSLLRSVPPEFRPASYRVIWLLAGALLLMVVVAGVMWRFLESKQTISRVIPLTSVLSQALQPAISQDGKKIAFVWNGDGNNFDIYVTQKGGNPLRITTDAAYDMRPSWSPDGSTIAYLRSTKATTDVMVVGVPGGELRRLFSLQSGLVRNLTGDQTQSLGNPGPTWTPDGKAVIISDQEPGHIGLSLFEHRLDSPQTDRLTTPEGESRDYSPQISPSGTYLAFTRNFTNSSCDLFLMPLHGGSIRRLTNEHADILGLAWLGDDHHILISSNRSGPYALWVVNTVTGMISPSSASGEGAIDPSANEAGNLIAYTDVSFNANIRQVTLGASGDSPSAPLFSSSHRNNSARYSPDGSRIAFASDRSGTWEIWVSDKNSTEVKKLTDFNGPMVGSPRWSPDGETIAFDARPSGASSVFLVSADGGKPRPVSPGIYEERQPSWSHDGKSLYFYSNRSGRGALWRVASDGKDARLISDEAAVDPQESTDGKFVYFTSKAHPGLMYVDSNGGTPQMVPGLETFAPNRLWQLTSDGIYYIESDESFSSLKRYDLRDHKLTKPTTLPARAAGNTPSLSISPDYRSVLVTLNDELRSNIMLLEVGKR